jgi:hypothetical protein
MLPKLGASYTLREKKNLHTTHTLQCDIHFLIRVSTARIRKISDLNLPILMVASYCIKYVIFWKCKGRSFPASFVMDNTCAAHCEKNMFTSLMRFYDKYYLMEYMITPITLPEVLMPVFILSDFIFYFVFANVWKILALKNITLFTNISRG